MPAQSLLKTIAAHAKEHHDSVNAAFVATYSPGIHNTTNIPSTRPSMDSQRTTSTSSSTSTLSKTWSSIKKHAKEHHESVNAAYATYYSGGMVREHSASSVRSSASTVAGSPRVSLEDKKGGPVVEVEAVEKGDGHVKKMARAIKKRAVEHHRSVTAAHRAYYG